MISSKFPEDDPRYTYACFIEAIIKQDYKDALEFCQLTWVETTKNPVNMLKQYFDGIEIRRCVYIKTTKTELNTAVVCDLKVKLEVKMGLIRPLFTKRKYKPRLIKEKGIRKPDVNGAWGVNPVSALKLI